MPTLWIGDQNEAKLIELRLMRQDLWHEQLQQANEGKY